MSTLLAYAIDRHAVRVSIAPADGSRPASEAYLFPLWHEAEHAPGVPHERPDVWRVLYRDAAGWRPGHVYADEVTILDVDPIAMPADIVTTNRAGSLQRAEMLCVFARFAVPIRFAYDKGAGVFESRHGTPLGFRAGKDGTLLVLADADRDNAKRSFKLGAVSGILAVGPIPRWESGVGWMRGTSPAPAEADPAGVSTEDLGDMMVDRRKS